MIGPVFPVVWDYPKIQLTSIPPAVSAPAIIDGRVAPVEISGTVLMGVACRTPWRAPAFLTSVLPIHVWQLHLESEGVACRAVPAFGRAQTSWPD